VGHGRGHFGDVADLGSQVAAHRVDAVGQVFPHPADARDARLTAELAFGSDITDHARHLISERVELVNHRVDGGHLKSRKNPKFGRKIGNSIMKNLELVTTPLWNCPYTLCRAKRIGLI